MSSEYPTYSLQVLIDGFWVDNNLYPARNYPHYYDELAKVMAERVQDAVQFGKRHEKRGYRIMSATGGESTARVVDCWTNLEKKAR